MAFTVVYDACVLYPPALRDFLIRLGISGMYRAKWSEDITNEVIVAATRDRPENEAGIRRSVDQMNNVLRDAAVEGYRSLIPSIELPDPNDRHVVAAAIRCGAQAIVTANIRDFPDKVLKQFDLVAITPDEFVTNALDLNEARVVELCAVQASELKNPPRSLDQVLTSLSNIGLPLSVARIRGALGM